MSQNRHRQMEDDNSSIGYDENQNCTLVVVVISLLFVAVFGGALVGGVLSGDPSNGFFVTIIVASCVVIGIAAIASIRYCLMNRKEEAEYIKESKGTFNSDNDEENAKKEKKAAKRPLVSTPPSRRITEVNAMHDIPGDVSALSPNTYDVDSVVTDGKSGITSFAGRIIQNKSRQRKAGFDFSDIVSGQPSRGREDPPEASDVSAASETTKKMGPKDPSASRISLNGNVEPIVEEELADIGLDTPTSRKDIESGEEKWEEKRVSYKSFLDGGS